MSPTNPDQTSQHNRPNFQTPAEQAAPQIPCPETLLSGQWHRQAIRNRGRK